MEVSDILIGFGAAAITAIVAVIAISLQLRAASKERLEAIYERLLSELRDVVTEMKDWDGVGNLSDEQTRVISRMLHLHLDTLVESIALEGRSWWRKSCYRLGICRHRYVKVGEEWFLEKHRYKRFEQWYSGTLQLYDRINASKYVEEVFHPGKDDPHKGIERKWCLSQYFDKRLKYERGK